MANQTYFCKLELYDDDPLKSARLLLVRFRLHDSLDELISTQLHNILETDKPFGHADYQAVLKISSEPEDGEIYERAIHMGLENSGEYYYTNLKEGHRFMTQGFTDNDELVSDSVLINEVRSCLIKFLNLPT